MEKMIDNMSIKDTLEAINIQNVDEIPYQTLMKILDQKIKNADSQNKRIVFQKIKNKITSKVNHLNLNNLILNDEGNFQNTVFSNKVIKDKQSSPETSFVTNIKGGVLNPLDRREQHYLLHINTKYREKRQNTKLGGGEGGNVRAIKLNNKSLAGERARQTAINQINISRIVISNSDSSPGNIQIDVYLESDIQDFEAFSSPVTNFGKYFNILSNNTNIDIFNSRYLNIDYGGITVDIISSRHLVFTTSIVWDPGNNKIINTDVNYANKDINIKNIPMSYVNDYGDINGKPIVYTDFNPPNPFIPANEDDLTATNLETYITNLGSESPFSDSFRKSQGLPPVRLYGKRELFKDPRDLSNKTYTVYGGYVNNSKALAITPPEQDDFENQTSNTIKNVPIHIESNTDFTINLSRNFEIIRMSLESFSFVNALYTFSNDRKNNFFYITDPHDSNNLIKIIIPSGTYTGGEIATYLNKRMETIDGLESLKVSWSHITGKIIFYYDNESECSDLTLYFGNIRITKPVTGDLNENLEQNAGWILGFKRASYTFHKIVPPEGSIMYCLEEKSTPQIESIGCYIEAESVYNPHQHKVVFLVVDDFNKNKNNTHINAYDGDSIHDNILAQISLEPGDSTNFTREKLTASIDYKSREYFGPVNVKRLQIKLVDELGNPIDINENDYMLTLKFDSLYNI